MKLILKPHEGAEPFQFGQSRSFVRHILPGWTTEPLEPENDFYPDIGLIIGYDASDELEFLEITHPSTCSLFNIDLFDTPTKPLLQELSKHEDIPNFEDDSFNFTNLCVVLYCPAGKVASVSLYRKGYYEDLES